MRRLYKYKRAGRWYARQVLPDGTTKNYPLGVTEKEGVRKAERALKILEERILFTPMSVTTLDEMARSFLSSKKDRVRQSTMRLYTHWVGNFVSFFGAIDPRTITLSEVERWQKHLLRTVSPSTVNIASASIQSLLNWGAERDYCDKLKKPPLVRVKKKSYPFISFEEFEARIVPHVNSDRLLVAFSLYMYTGMRRTEAARLLWSDVHLGTQRIFVRSDGSSETKSGKSRWVPIHPTLSIRLKRLTRTGPYVLQGNGEVPDAEALMRRWNETLKRAGVPMMRLHDLRGSYATELLKIHPPAIVQKILGHKDIGTTMRYYSRLTEQDAVDVVLSTPLSTHSSP